MADSYSVKAILSATDKGFTSTLRNALGTVDSLASKVKSGFAFGVLTGMGQQAFSALTNGARDLVGEVNSANKAWKTYEGNMQILGKSSDEIAKVKADLQDFAEKSIYSSSDMASTYAQLASVGTASADKLVIGFGGLAAAAVNPTQAMKTLSQQAVQMAAKPNVAWADFKLMLEQTPAGMAAVAKQMGKTSAELVADIQAGKVTTEEFFTAINEVGNSEGFQDLAKSYKGVDEAMAGLKETLGNKLTPAFDALSQIAIKGIEGISAKFGEIEGDELADKVTGWIKKAQPMWNSFTNAVSKVWGVISGLGKKVAPVFSSLKTQAAGAVQAFLDKVGSIDVNAIIDKVCGWAKKAQPYFDLFKSAISAISDAVTAALPYIIGFAAAVGGFFLDHADTISKCIPYVIGLVAAYKGFKIVSALVPGVASFAQSIVSMASGGIKGLAAKLFGVAGGQKAAGSAAATSAKQLLAAGAAFLMIGAGVALIGVSFALLAQSAIALAEAGGLAIGVMAGMTIGVIALGVGMALLLKSLAPMSAQLMPAALAMLAMGGAVVLVAAGFALLAQTAISLSSAGGLAIGVMAGMVAVVALLAVGAAALGPALTAGAVGFIAFGAAIVLVGAGAVLAAAALTMVSAVLPAIVANGMAGAGAIAALGAGMIVFAAGAALAGAAAIVLGAGLVVAAAGITLVGAGVMVAAAGVLALGAGALVLAAALALCGASTTLLGAALPMAAAGATAAVASFAALLAASTGLAGALVLVEAPLALIAATAAVTTVAIAAFDVAMLAGSVSALAMAAALKAIKSSMKSIASSAKSAESSLDSMQSSVKVVESGLNALGSKAKDAMSKITSAFDDTADKAVTAGEAVGEGFTTGMQGGLSQAPAVAATAVTSVAARLRAGYSLAFGAGAYISQGFAAGMLSCLGVIEAAAARMAAAAEKAIAAKAKIHSPSKVTTNLGEYYGTGWVNGILSKVKESWKAAENLVALPNVKTPALAGAYGGEMSGDYDYYRNAEYIIVVPLNVDGREVARTTATYMQEELNRKQTRESRKRGKV